MWARANDGGGREAVVKFRRVNKINYQRRILEIKNNHIHTQRMFRKQQIL